MPQISDNRSWRIHDSIPAIIAWIFVFILPTVTYVLIIRFINKGRVLSISVAVGVFITLFVFNEYIYCNFWKRLFDKGDELLPCIGSVCIKQLILEILSNDTLPYESTMSELQSLSQYVDNSLYQSIVGILVQCADVPHNRFDQVQLQKNWHELQRISHQIPEG